jgi:hypothetical protein
LKALLAAHLDLNAASILSCWYFSGKGFMGWTSQDMIPSRAVRRG